MAQEGDVLLFVGGDGTANVNPTLQADLLAFTVSSVNGLLEMTPGFDTAISLSLFGGAFRDDGVEGNPETFWGNLTENDPSRKYISVTQWILQGLPATSHNLQRVEEAVLLDLGWFLTEKIASSVTASVSLPGVNRVQIDIVIEARGVETEFTFTENWKAST